MQRIATEIGYSETAFLEGAEAAGAALGGYLRTHHHLEPRVDFEAARGVVRAPRSGAFLLFPSPVGPAE